jgi:basic membrane protein A and related proteins
MTSTVRRGAPVFRPWAALVAAVALVVGACAGASASPAGSASSGTGASSAPNVGGSASAPGSAAVSPTGLKAIYVSTEPIGVNPFLQLIAKGLQDGGTQCGVETKVVESADTTALADNLQAAVDDGYDLIVANSFDSVDAVTKLSKEHPNQKFALVDTSIEGNPNVRGLVFNEHEGSYLLGAIFGLLASGQYEGYPKSDRIGAVGAVDQPFIRRWYVGFAEGVKKVDPSATLDLGWATGFNDPATSKELALAQNQKGAKYIFAFSAAGNTGIFEAAKEKNFFTSGVDTDQRTLDPDHVIESMVKRSDVGVHDAVCDLAKNQFTGGAKAYGLAQNAVGPAFLVLSNPTIPTRLPQAVQDQVKDLAAKIVSGEIKVTDYLSK